MEQVVTLEFARGESALLMTLIVLVVMESLITFQYRRLVRRWRSVGILVDSRKIISRVFAPLLIVVLLGLTYAEPFLVQQEEVFQRNDVEVCYLFDNAGSMAASLADDTPTRMDRALSIARELSLSEAMAGVPTCIGTFTSQPSLHLPATAHLPTVLSVLDDIIVVGDPPPEASSCRKGEVCTDLKALSAAKFFFGRDKDEAHRIFVVFTDGETKEFNESTVSNTLRTDGVDVIFVDLWSTDEQIFNTSGCVELLDGCIDPEYESDLLGRETFLGFAQISGSPVISEEDAETLADTTAAMLGISDEEGVVPISLSEVRQPLAWFFAALAGIVAFAAYSEHILSVLSVRKRFKANRK